ncbi:M56 family metallopeptidase [Maribellus maritimus]|uniref:M56 family metallopeptidase n=1 Tax=Maribellus maritimus TaxID=2870838 RepID=UPI001EEAE9CD|nr:M56 family metallopeptidase [Maribellus maritimus]MCG6190317.1 carboxypeptidase-like regulatory domain-containing protein [Maribellus maritimus]
MEALFTFLVNASGGIILFYVVYWVFLRNETFYNANRWFLFMALISAVLLPLFPLKYQVIIEPENNATVLKTISDTFKHIPVVSGTEFERQGFNWHQGVLLVYLTGASIFLLRLLIQTFILIYLIIKYRVKSLDGIRIVENEKYGLPFSFFNVVFINPKFHKQENLPEILAHEKVHIRENHWFDLLFIELLTVIFWFNPFIWFFERSMKQNHEYLADKGVVSMGYSVARYQALLLNQLMGMQIIGITNNLNFALNTNRLKMMTKTKTSALGRVKLLWALPAVALLLFAFAEPEYRVSSAQNNKNTNTIVDFSGQKKITVRGIVLDEKGDPLPGTSVVIKGGTRGTVCDMDGTFKLDVPENASIVLSFVGKKTISDSYAEITSGEQKGDTFNRKYTMKNFITTIVNNSYDGDYRTSYDGERLAPPPPPPPPPPKEAVPANGKTPPPPSVIQGDEEVFYIIEVMPHFPGGYYARQDYILRMQQEIAKAEGIKGKAKVLFTVNAKGKVTDIKIVEKDNEGAARGAVMLVSGMPDWTPGKQRGKAVPVKYLLPVVFR